MILDRRSTARFAEPGSAKFHDRESTAKRRTNGFAGVTTMVIAAIIAALIGIAPAATPDDPSPVAPICHVATADGDLLHSSRCSTDELVYRLGYTPEPAHLPGGRPVHVEPDGSCSSIPDRPFGFDFRDACRTHDLGYDLLRVGWVGPAAKAVIDRNLRDNMLDACAGERGLRGLACRVIATSAWLATSLVPTPTDPDPGSFTSNRSPALSGCSTRACGWSVTARPSARTGWPAPARRASTS